MLRGPSYASRIIRGVHHYRTTGHTSHSVSNLPPTSVVFSGIQPTGVPHLGNYLGTLQQWAKLQHHAPAAVKLIFSIVDLHAVTTPQPREYLRRWKIQTLSTLLAVGLDPARCILFCQSDVPAHAELFWLLSCTASMGYLSRMTQWKSKLALPQDISPLDTDSKARLKLGLFAYPVLQASDILVHGSTHVPVGEDQLQHIEFARECAGNFNAAHGEYLTKPVALLSPAKRIMSLKDPRLKMSKSHEDPRSRILLSDSDEDIKNKIKFALTDSHDGISYNVTMRPGVSNLIDILASVRSPDVERSELVTSLNHLSMRAFKEHVADQIIGNISQIRERYFDILPKTDWLETILTDGALRARQNASSVLDKAYRGIGLDSSLKRIQ